MKTQIRVHSSKDLAEIKELAQDRKCWRGFASHIDKAAEVSQAKNWDANGNKSNKSSKRIILEGTISTTTAAPPTKKLTSIIA